MSRQSKVETSRHCESVASACAFFAIWQTSSASEHERSASISQQKHNRSAARMHGFTALQSALAFAGPSVPPPPHATHSHKIMPNRFIVRLQSPDYIRPRSRAAMTGPDLDHLLPHGVRRRFPVRIGPSLNIDEHVWAQPFVLHQDDRGLLG